MTLPMIKTLVVDDDFRVARIHATSVERVDGFVCTGQAHNAQEARRLIAEDKPDLLILDVYLPDEDGLNMYRSLAATDEHPPDCIFITAARDLASVRSAIGMGAIYYLVKPFGLQQLQQQLQAYRRWRLEVLAATKIEEADQATVDALYSLRHAPTQRPTGPRLPPTMAKVLATVDSSLQPLPAATVAEQLGISRPTAQRYLTELERRGLLELELEYGATGRPIHRYSSLRRP
ncbi:MAG: response regulator [Actinomycetota bacterium]|nr:response regulator [Actinomycetota bacterium]MDQ2956299.1 response regulator [Actinomycetota bacterium]